MSILIVKNLKKVYGGEKGFASTVALNSINFSVNSGEFVAIMGESGSGKSTLLNIIATLDKATVGQVILDGKDLSTHTDAQLAAFRRERLGFVFQDFNLLNNFNNKDNVFLPLVLSGVKLNIMEKRLAELQAVLGISELMQKYPYQISGGEKQRVAIARALITQPSLILADEPTGALDSKSSAQVLDIFENLQRMGQTILMVTHSRLAAAHAGRVLFIKDGIVYHEIYRGAEDARAFEKRITESSELLNQGGLYHA